MSRRKKTRSLKGKLNVKTGSKKDFIARGEKGQIPTHNRLAKHKKRQKSAYQKYLEANNLTDSTTGTPPAVKPPRLYPADTEEVRSEVDTLETDKGFDELSGDELLDRFERS
ncbi:hypothetical protein [Saccharospirillum mangrovi]|uniref:hypothetical protein n=1 Tax=Saccharospirillum mangrovi TaxID=2161747 RepID=UPI000D336748|nr:hypothetical protein [Saccharospirillum mangrovi]